MKYYIRTTGERKLDESYNQIDYELLIDKNHEYINFFIDQLERVGVEDCVIIEDDCVLCKDFKRRIEEVISQYPNKIINFFQLPSNKWFMTYESDSFLMNQCTYYPKDLSVKLAKTMREVYKDNLGLSTDQVENLALKEMNETHIKYRPCLVQHLNFHSLLNHAIECRRTPFFVDYLDKLNLNYNALNKTNIKKLTLEMKFDIERRRRKLEKL